MKPLDDTRLSDAATERVIRSIREAVREIQDLPASSIRVIRNIVLPNGVEVFVAHKLGRAPDFVTVSCVRFANPGGTVRDFASLSPVTGQPIDRTKVVVLRADGYGATITVDVMVA